MRNTTGGELQTDQVRAVSAADYDRAGDGASADLDLYNLRGQRVRTLLRQVMPAGEHGIPWRGDDESGGAVASGTYVVRLLVNGHHVFRQRLAMVR